MSTNTPTITIPAGPFIVEYDPGLFVDLAQAVEAQLIDGDLHVLLSAPTAFGRGPHVVSLVGEPRDLALAYFRARAAVTRAALLAPDAGLVTA
jgi:hypothetical protein